MKKNITLSSEDQSLLDILKKRFEKNSHRHKTIQWEAVAEQLQNNPEKLKILLEMEDTQGEPDVIGYDEKTKQYIFCDCSAESPKGRRSVCYDHEALESRKEHKPKHSALGMAAEMGIELLTEEEYHQLQLLENFDLKTSSWLKTEDTVRELGGAIFGDKRFGRVFIYHNGAESYYGARGFRGKIKI